MLKPGHANVFSVGLGGSDAAARRFPQRLAACFDRSIFTPIIALAAIIVFHLDAGPYLEYSRRAPLELYRVLTCHLAHFSVEHLLWDVAALLILGTFVERLSRRRFWWAIGSAMLLIPLFVHLFQDQLLTYRGLSGIDSALFTLVATSAAVQSLRQRRWIALAALLAVLVLFSGKVAVEFIGGTAMFVDGSEFVAVPLAHLVGGACGMAAGLIPPRRNTGGAYPGDAPIQLRTIPALPSPR